MCPHTSKKIKTTSKVVRDKSIPQKLIPYPKDHRMKNVEKVAKYK
jgi:hypothetical protein